MQKGRIIIISGPSGSGKTTLSEMLLKSRRFKGRIVQSISMTTRAPRRGERNGRDYFFISRKMFEFKKRAGHFLESMQVFTCYYGTPDKQVREHLRAGRHVLLCIDVKGARVVWQKHPDAIRIFVKTPNFSILKQRLSARCTETALDLQTRLQTAREELKESRFYHYILVNDRLDRAYQELEDYLTGELIRE